MLAGRIDQFSRDDGRGNSLGGIDDLLDTGYTKRDVHGSDTGEMESFQRHLSTGFTNRLGTDGSYSRSRLDYGTEISDSTDFKESMNLIASDLVCVLDNLLDCSWKSVTVINVVL